VLGPASRETFRSSAIVAAVAAGLFAAVAVLVGTGAADAFDADVRTAIHRWAAPSQPWLTAVMRAVTELGSTMVLLALCAVVALTLYILHRRRLALSLALTLIATMLANTALKVLFQRARPEPFYGDILETLSFPSGHSAFACAFYMSGAAVAAAHVRSRALHLSLFAAAAAFIAVIGFSRVYLGVHYPTDVIGGWLVGLTSVAAARIIDSRPRA
jgi:undecaprenyl-diphosphatase